MKLFQCACLIGNQFCLIKFSHMRHFSSVKRAALCIGVDILAGGRSRHSLPGKMNENVRAVNSGHHQGVLRFSDYDCIGFDLDNTLVKYKLTELMTLEYDMLAKYLVEVKGYDPKHLLAPFSEGVKFVQRCLFVDFDRGNIVKLGARGEVVKATHGTRFLTESEIRDAYGPDKLWEDGLAYMKDPLEAWRGPLSSKLRPLLDFFDAPSALVFARIINSLDENGVVAAKYKVWPDVLDGLIHMFSPENFNLGVGYFHSMRSDVGKYVHPVDHQVVEWLKSLRQQGKKLFLLTGSGLGFASIVAEHSLGSEWRSLFDIVISYARKPWFFLSKKEEKPFFKICEPDFVEENKVAVPQLNCNVRYEQGSWDGLSIALADATGKEIGGKVLYVGDNIIQDVYSPVKYTTCETVAICEEMGAHMAFDGSEKYFDSVLRSSDWGSFFSDNKEVSFWSDVLSKSPSFLQSKSRSIFFKEGKGKDKRNRKEHTDKANCKRGIKKPLNWWRKRKRKDLEGSRHFVVLVIVII
ncbi:5'-nucleotidase domain-containing protein 1 [Ischnura elegans]|uniref:5'-nucleotidase domain-containing protein 1 n=1 Tax=Ischnura elegans TaxID=197161 RepID=UPI001ED87F83|nr:5'-nucleotidase domain-containing protein 1 [Ischnura elegans]